MSISLTDPLHVIICDDVVAVVCMLKIQVWTHCLELQGNLDSKALTASEQLLAEEEQAAARAAAKKAKKQKQKAKKQDSTAQQAPTQAQAAHTGGAATASS